MKRLLSIFLICLGVSMSSCDFEGYQVDPNNLSEDQGDIDFLLNNVQLSLPGFFGTFSNVGQDLTRMTSLFGSNYDNAYTSASFSGVWTTAYAGILIDAAAVAAQGKERELYVHAAIAETISAYVLITLVDNFGDIPYTEALDANNLNPAADTGADVYETALALLNEAKADLAKQSIGVPAADFYYDGDTDNWEALINTLMLKIHLQRRLVNASGSTSAIEGLLSSNLIDESSENFIFVYSSASTQAPDSRHPDFVNNYGGGSDYMSTYYMNLLLWDKQNIDPRFRYYFYRQTTDDETRPGFLPCIAQNVPAHYPFGTPFCRPEDDQGSAYGFWGRDHLNNDGIPPDGGLRTLHGVYPAGGRFDANQGETADFSMGYQGAGIRPIWMSSYTDFLIAEAILTLGVTGDASASLQSGVRKSINYVMSVGQNAVDLEDAEDFVPEDDDIDTYVVEVASLFNAATTTEAKLDVVIKEFMIALWGNGIEMYNAYRRTGYPSDIQPSLQADPGDFYRSLTYPAAYVDRNSNATQKAGNAVQIFWDNNPAGFID